MKGMRIHSKKGCVNLKVEEFIEENIPFIKDIASNFYNVPFEDLMQAGTLGVLKALKKYRQDGTIKFSTYAYDYIYGEMYDFVMKDRKVKVSKEMLRLAKKVKLTTEALTLKTGHVPTYEEIGHVLKLSPYEVMQLININHETISFDKETLDERNLYETIPAVEKLSLDDKITLQNGMDTLPESEQKILEYRYFEDLTQSETAKKMGMTQVMVSRYESRSLKRLRKYYEVA